MSEALQILQNTFGFPSFRSDQEEVIDLVAAGGDALVLMPTGGGKSLCYQIPSLLRPGVGVVVSPLIALMQDQVSALLQSGVKAACLNSSMPADEQRRVEDELCRGALDIVYVAPERLVTPRFMELLARCELALFAIDEAHCVSQWGHDFRPEYLALAVLAERFPIIPRVALTATADEATRKDIAERLHLTDAPLFVTGFDRPNIRYTVVPKSNVRSQFMAFYREHHRGHSGIIYCLSRRKVDQTAQWLLDQGIDAMPYHAGLDGQIRKLNQDRFIREEGMVMVATIAFGMGIDKPDVRFVAHMDLPKSMEAYYQETGRAGRDGEPANAWMAYGLGDVVAVRRMLAMSEADETHRREERRKLDALLGYCETTLCLRGLLLNYFGEPPKIESCGNCSNCLDPVESWDATVAAQKALSCAYRTGQRFGATYLTDVLLGLDSERISQFGHDKVSTFGIGNDLDRAGWLSVYRQLTALGFLAVDPEGHGSLQLTGTSRPVLKGEKPLRLRKDPAPKRAARKTQRPSSAKLAPSFGGDPLAGELWERLRALRQEIAKEQGVPPYVIFSNRTLAQMVELAPSSDEELLEVAGVGQKKLERYGERFLAAIDG